LGVESHDVEGIGVFLSRWIGGGAVKQQEAVRLPLKPEWEGMGLGL
jgi:hypothetical protein